ncbi:hypothetical protein R6Q59_002434 [Mikania micrantha]
MAVELKQAKKLMAMKKLVRYVMYTLTILLCNGICFSLITPKILNLSRMKPLTFFLANDLNADNGGVKVFEDVDGGEELQQISDDLSVAGVRLLNSYDTCIQIIRNSLKLNTVVHIIRSREKLNTFGV